MTAKKATEKHEETDDETVDAPEETVDETTDEAVAEAPAVEVDNSKHETALFTGSLGGHVLLDSATAPASGALMGAVIGTPPSGIPGASQFAALQHKQVG